MENISTKLSQLNKRIEELEVLANEIYLLAKKMMDGEKVQPELLVKGQRWYRGCREILVQQKFSGLDEFDYCYESYSSRGTSPRLRSFSDIEQYIKRGTSERNKLQPSQKDHFQLFEEYFLKARSLVLSVIDEVISRELPIVTQLSFTVAADEFDTAEKVINKNNEIAIRVAGVLGRIALERHLLTVIESKNIKMIINPPSKSNPGMDDITNTLEKNYIINSIQKSELESLYKIGSNCAHPKDAVKLEDVERLLERGKYLASIIL